jgi:dihydrolipoamide dehydrogenase
MSEQVIVIGGGPAGIEAARAASAAGARVTLVSEGPVGGRAGWHSLAPSKVWLTVADMTGLLSRAPALGIEVDGANRPDPAAVLARIRTVTGAWNAAAESELQSLGVKVVTGIASFASVSRLSVAGDDGATVAELQGDAVIVATGSVPHFPDGMKPDGDRVLAPRFAGRLEELPPDVVVIGGGATGCEFAYLFGRLGVQVTWLVSPRGVLPMFAPAAGRFLAEAMVRLGIDLSIGPRAEQIDRGADGVIVRTETGQSYEASTAFLAVGRRPDVGRLNLDLAELEPGPAGELQTDPFGRTAVPSIYAVGDVTGTPMLANQATAQAWVAGRHAAGLPTPPFRPEAVVHAVYTEPQVAQVGGGPEEAPGVEQVRVPLAASLKAHLLAESEGFVELSYQAQSGNVLGGVAAGPHAAEVLAPIAVAIQLGATIEDLAAAGSANPTLSELAFLAARRARRPGFPRPLGSR